ncbi:flagellar biosynthesis anti-sigma factor FlgM [Hydrogenovibrio sp. SC-1]|uniref:flagellar biosynthesis anti-sigma factor FlgM n=1 Tax=Hydrogenovibrio sp. SC-1 TaxID=2065820 RepID=UPI000C7B6F33|nr:flagellar biosynthesis anti-sigma factor FlgM [Hydrogenovibrio sp. SC-1]PLA74925.1 flagellar biosynthesis anti-sigma factor FlgM [Hydrogenovibrio sp. SC-1]
MDIKNLNSGLVNSRLNESSQTTAKNPNAANNSKASDTTTDQVTLTSVSSQVKNLEEKAASSTVDNQEKINALKAAIQDGSYQVDAQSVANKLIQTEVLFATR